MTREATLLQQLAERPDDRALRLVFSDWLLEQGDDRGEVIALWARGNLSLTERRRVARITSTHAARWLGPLASLSDLHRTRFHGGFLDELVCVPSRPPEAFAALLGEPRLATVRSLVVPPTQQPTALSGFLSSPVLAGLRRLELGSSDWQELKHTPQLGSLAPGRVVVGSWGMFRGELDGLRLVPLFQQASALGLSTTEYISPIAVSEIQRAVVDQQDALANFEELMLIARFGVFEGAGQWLLACDRSVGGTRFPTLQRWGVEYADVLFVRSREPGGPFDHLTIDLSLPEAGEKRASNSNNAEARIAAAGGVLVQLGPARLTSVVVKLPEGGRLRSSERGMLLAGARRSGTLQQFSVVGEAPIMP